MPGSLAIPNVFLNHSPSGVSVLDTDLQTIADYVNIREVTLGTLAARPAAGNPGRWYVATDVSGGTLYVDTGGVWLQVASGVLGQGGGMGLILASAYGGGF